MFMMTASRIILSAAAMATIYWFFGSPFGALIAGLCFVIAWALSRAIFGDWERRRI